MNDIKHADVNFAELARYYEEHPLPLKQVMPIDEDEDEATAPNHKAGPASEVHLYKPAASGMTGARTTASMITSPNPTDTFLSTSSPGTNIPPDTHGAVDSLYCVTAINTNVHIQDRTGHNLHNVSLNAFWASVLPSGTDAFDPRVFYDAYNNRWIMVTDAVNQSDMGTSTLLVGVSATEDPRATWHLYSYPIDPTGASWLDFPNVGYNNKWVVVAGNMFGSLHGASIYVFDYAAMRAGSTLPTPTKFRKSSSFSVCPAQTFSPTEPNIFCLETWSGSNGQLQLWKISGAVGSPTLTSVGFPATGQHWHTAGPGGNDFGPQTGSANRLDMGDHRITSVILRNNKLWCAHNVFLPASSSATRCSIMWWQMDTLGNPVQNGLIDDPTSAFFYAYPSIAVNKDDDALIGCGVFSSAIHPSAGYALHLHTDAADSIHSAHIYRTGQATYYTTFGGSKNRWGDYSAASVDPVNDVHFWTIQEASKAGSSANWDTWWAHVCPSTPLVSYSVVSNSIHTGNADVFTFTGSAGAGATYAWSFGGGTGLPGTGAGPQTVTWGTGGTKTVTLTVTVNGCSASYTDTIHVSASVAIPVAAAQQAHVNVVPNPNDGSFALVFGEAVNTPVKVVLTDMEGRIVYTNEFAGTTGNRVQVRTADLAPGMYTAQIQVDGNMTTEKITISR